MYFNICICESIISPVPVLSTQLTALMTANLVNQQTKYFYDHCPTIV